MAFDKFVVGSLYAVIVNLVVTGVINWLTPLPAQPFVLARVVVAWFILALCLGIPIAWKAYRYYGIQPSASRRTSKQLFAITSPASLPVALTRGFAQTIRVGDST